MTPLRPEAREGNTAGAFVQKDSVHVNQIGTIIVLNNSMIIPDLVK